jgi:transcriptional regulator with XRE-family HTH domain
LALSRLIGSRLRDQRLALGLKQSDVAQAAGMSSSFLNLIEHNRRRVSAEGLSRLAAVLGTPVEQIGGGDDAALIADLRAAAVGTDAEAARTDEFVLRFPGWAKALALAEGRAAQAERAVGALNDRLAHDPYLSQALHDLLSAISSVRSTAAILADTPDIEEDWRLRFHQNLHTDADRMATGAEALVAYLDGTEGDSAATLGSPHEEVDAWFAGQGWHLAGLETGDKDEVLEQATMLASGAARTMAQSWVNVLAGDVAALPFDAVMAALEKFGPDPLQIASETGVSPMSVFRRLGTMPGSEFGLVLCDGAGSLTFRKPAFGFSIPRFGAACALWPVFAALRRPGTAIEQAVTVPGRTGQSRFLLRAFAQIRRPVRYGAPELCDAAMLIVPDSPAPGSGAQLAVGATCRICVQVNCDGRREPTILSGL